MAFFTYMGMGEGTGAGVGREGGEEVGQEWELCGHWSVLIKMLSPQTGIGGLLLLLVWITAIGPGCVMWCQDEGEGSQLLEGDSN